MAAPTPGRARRASLARRLLPALAATLAIVLTGCSGDAPTPAETINALPDAAEVEAAVDDEATGEVTDDLVPAPGFVARAGALAVNEQQCTRDYGYSTIEDVCLMGHPDGERTMVLWGDSRAAMWMPALHRIAEQAGYRLAVFTKMGCAPLLGVTPWLAAEERPYDECSEFNDQVPEVSETLFSPDVVVLTGAIRNLSLTVDGEERPLGQGNPDNTWTPDPDADRLWQAGLERTLVSLGDDQGTEVFVLGEAPYPSQDAATCVAEHESSLEECAADRDEAVYVEHDRAVQRTTEGAGATYVPTLPWLCGETTCPAVIDDHVVFRDSFHLNREYVLWISRALSSALGLEDRAQLEGDS